MKINDKKKFIVRISELIIIIASLILTPIAINYANTWRGYDAVGGEYLLPLVGLVAVMFIETIYEETKDKRGGKHAKR